MRAAGRPDTAMERGERWASHWGSGYSHDFKMREVRPLIEQIDRAGLLGDRILDAGCGSMPSDGPVYPLGGKKIVRMDIGAPERTLVSNDILQMKCDIENLTKEDLAMAFGHVGAKGTFSAIMFLDILNYVDSERTLGFFLRFLERGGRMIISNFANMGIESLFSDKRPTTNLELLGQVSRLGLDIEHLYHPPLIPPWLPGSEPYSRPRYPSLMPGRERGSMIVVAARG